MSQSPFDDLADAELRAFRARIPTPPRLSSAFAAWSNLRIHLDRHWRAHLAGDDDGLRRSLVELAAEARRTAEDLDLELGGRFGEMAGIAYRKASPRGCRPIASAAELAGLLAASHAMLQWACTLGLAEPAGPGAFGLADALDLDEARPLDCLLSLYVTARRGAEDLGLTPRPQAA